MNVLFIILFSISGAFLFLIIIKMMSKHLKSKAQMKSDMNSHPELKNLFIMEANIFKTTNFLKYPFTQEFNIGSNRFRFNVATGGGHSVATIVRLSDNKMLRIEPYIPSGLNGGIVFETDFYKKVVFAADLGFFINKDKEPEQFNKDWEYEI